MTLGEEERHNKKEKKMRKVVWIHVCNSHSEAHFHAYRPKFKKRLQAEERTYW